MLVFGVAFLAIIGYLFDKQPFYIQGPEDKAGASTSCYHAAGIYFLVWVVSVLYCKRDDARVQQEGESSAGR